MEKTDKKMPELKEAKQNEVVKFENVGDKISGTFVKIEQSPKYEDGYGLSYIENGKPKIVFVSKMVKDLIENNAVPKGAYIEVEYTHDQKTKDNKKTYRAYTVRYA